MSELLTLDDLAAMMSLGLHRPARVWTVQTPF